MNRLVIIGNGFDLAHGLKTKYSDFIDDFWSNVLYDFKPPQHKANKSIINLNIDFTKSHNLIDYEKLKQEIEEISSFKKFNEFKEKYNLFSPNRNIISLIFKNDFFSSICYSKKENWVDIESEYYYQLKEIAKEKNPYISKKDEEFWLSKKEQRVKKLNDEFEQIKQLFEKYLKDKIEPLVRNKSLDLPNILPFCYRDEEKLEKFFKEFSLSDYKDLKQYIEKFRGLHTEQIEQNIILGNLPFNAVFLNFNYTSSLSNYKITQTSFVKEIQIHGKIDDKNNKMNFGFGDEMDDDYKMIENLNENEYLRNFKSFGYSQNSNYKDLLNFIDSEKFQVYIMGHSCGISDRTMLNTIFEHNNCRSIKIFYHQWKDENGQLHDNYTEIVQNISRHFNEKKLMREKVVNKSLCVPLPQIKNDLQL